MQPLPAPTAQGQLSKSPLAHLFVYLAERRLSGSLELRGPNGMGGSVVFVQGIPRKARTPDGIAYLGGILLDNGLVTEAQVAESLQRRASSGRLQGEILVEMGLLDHDTLVGGLAAQLEAKILYLFSSPPETIFSFYEGVNTLQYYGGPDIVELDPLSVVWAGVRQNPSWEHANAALSRVGNFGVRLNASAAPERCGFGKGEQIAIDLLRQRPLRLTDLSSARVMSPAAVQLFVYFLLITKQAELVDLQDARAPFSAAPGTPAPAVAPAASARPGAAFARVQLQSRPVGLSRIVEEHRPVNADARNTDPRLTPQPNTYVTSEPPTEQAAPAAPSFSPSAPPARFPGIAHSSTPPKNASAISTSPSSPAEPAGSPGRSMPPPPMKAGGSMPPPPMKAGGSMPPPPMKAGGSMPPPPAGGADDALRSKIVARAENIASQTHYEMLGVAHTATPEEIQKAFFALAKVWHPDKLPPALTDVKDACSKVFTHLSNANATLSDAAKRLEYDKLLKEGGGGGGGDEQAQVQKVLEASNNFQKAQILLKRNDLAQGEELARKALSADPGQAQYIALVAWLDSQKPQNQTRDRTFDCIKKLDEAIRLNAKCERAYYYRGMLHKRTDNMKAALKDLKKAVELNPNNLDASREIRLYNMRTNVPATKDESIGGLFGRLFKK